MNAYVKLKRDWLPIKGSTERLWIVVLKDKGKQHTHGFMKAVEEIPVSNFMDTQETIQH